MTREERDAVAGAVDRAARELEALPDMLFARVLTAHRMLAATAQGIRTAPVDDDQT